MSDLAKQELEHEVVRPNYACRWLLNSRSPGRLTCGISNSGSEHHDLVNEFYDIIYNIEGEGIFIDQMGNRTEILPGMVFQRVPGLLHSTIFNSGPHLQWYISMPPYHWQSLVDIGLIDGSQKVFNPGLDNSLADYFKQILKLLRTPSAANHQKALLLMDDFLFEVRELEKSSTAKSTKQQDLEKAIELLADSKYFHYSIREITEKANIGYETFRKQFRQIHGLSPHHYRIRRRIEFAITWLMETGKSIEEISLLLNYPDPFTFSKQFKQITGNSPQQYRNKY